MIVSHFRNCIPNEECVFDIKFEEVTICSRNGFAQEFVLMIAVPSALIPHSKINRSHTGIYLKQANGNKQLPENTIRIFIINKRSKFNYYKSKNYICLTKREHNFLFHILRYLSKKWKNSTPF